MHPPAVVLTDIEGTTTRIAFVRDVLFPYARARLPALVAQAPDFPEIAAQLDETCRLVPASPPIETLLAWMDEDAKAPPLKTLQGIIWQEGYLSGNLRSHLYPDVAPALRRWHRAGLQLAVYSSGSVAAQRLLFAHSPDGDLTGLFSDFHDTRVGSKRDVASYSAIAALSGRAASDFLFLSDIGAELDAAADAGMAVCQIVRTEDSTIPVLDHSTALDFNAVERLWQP